jgi:hypothetical protein
MRSAHSKSGEVSINVRAIGEDPIALRQLSPKLSIWDAYATIHLIMPDGSMKVGGEAVAEVLKNLPATHWFTWVFSLKIFGLRPFQTLLNLAYAMLAAVRPIFGCESCGTPPAWMRPLRWIVQLTARKAVPNAKASTSFLPAKV